MNNISNFTRCANCGACYNACPVNAITVGEGLFYKVQVNEEQCVSCGLCKKVCPVNTPLQKQDIRQVYAAVSNDSDIVKNSSSGGAFSELAQTVLDQNGVVFGAAYSADCRKVEMRSTENCSLEQLRRSKYVESLPGMSFRDAKAALEEGRMVLYCGAPCQIAGLVRYLGRDYDNLITCDFSCGGMQSHQFYNQYLDSIKKKLGAPVAEVNFRPKTYGWMHHAIKIKATNGRVYQKLAQSDPFFYCFLYNRFGIRDYCYECDFADNHYSDLILADFWKYASISQLENNNKGISLVVTNSLKGQQFLAAHCKKMALTVIDLQEGCYNIQKRVRNEEHMEKRSRFLKDCTQNGFIATMKNVKLPKTLVFRIKYLAKKCLGKLNG